MDEPTQQLAALTDQRVSFTLAGKPYSARRATLNDLGMINRYRRDKEQSGDDANLDLDASLYILTQLMEPDYHLTSEELGAKFDLTQYNDITEVIKELNGILESLGLRAPQITGATTP